MTIPVTLIRAKFLALKPVMDERLTRLWAGAEAEAIGAGGITLVAAATGMSRTTIRAGRDELRKGVAACDVVKVRRAGAGRPSIEKRKPEIIDALEHLLEPVARGDREAPLRWTSKSTRKLSAELDRQGFSISPQKVAQLLHAGGYRLLGVDRPVESTSHALRGQQLALINDRVQAFQSRGAPVIAVETRKQLASPLAPGGASRWDNVRVTVPDLRACDAGALAPGASEMAQDAGWVNAEVDHETPTFAVRAISDWWEHMGRRVCSGATELLVIAAASGTYAHARRWRAELQLFADRTRLTIGVSHFPPGTSKWTRVEHSLICRITERWCDRPAVARGASGAAGSDGLTGGAAGRAARGTAPPIHDVGNAEPDGFPGAGGTRAHHGTHGSDTGNGGPDGLDGATGRGLGGIHRETVVQLIGAARPLVGSLPLTALDAHGLPPEWNYTLHPRRDRW